MLKYVHNVFARVNSRAQVVTCDGGAGVRDSIKCKFARSANRPPPPGDANCGELFGDFSIPTASTPNSRRFSRYTPAEHQLERAVDLNRPAEADPRVLGAGTILRFRVISEARMEIGKIGRTPAAALFPRR